VKTVDGGDNWTALSISPGYSDIIIVDPTDSRTVYANSIEGVAKSGDAGASWKVVLPSASLLALTGGGAAAVLYASNSDNLLVVSTNAGDTWAQSGFRQNRRRQSWLPTRRNREAVRRPGL
jgi:hypothetical protein